MKTIKRFFLSTAAVTAALITGCTPEEEHMPVQGGDSFTLSSSEEQVITRAGDVSVSHFTGGTKYRLYGLVGGAWNKKLPTMNGQEGTEAVAADIPTPMGTAEAIAMERPLRSRSWLLC